jgi:hypothetical protein
LGPKSIGKEKMAEAKKIINFLCACGFQPVFGGPIQ